MDPASHSERSIENATRLVASLASKRSSHTSYPYQQDEVSAAVYRRAHNSRRSRNRGCMPTPRPYTLRRLR